MPAPPIEAPHGPLTEAELISELADLQRHENALAARRHTTILRFARLHAAAHTAHGNTEPEKLEHSIAAQIGAACRVSAAEGGKRLRTARTLHDGHDHVRLLFTAGLLSEYKTTVITTATAHLTASERAQVDRQLAARGVETLGVRRLHDLTQSLAAAVAPEKFTARCHAAVTGRRVSVRPATDGMADLIAHLPVEQAVACYAALRKQVNEIAVNPEPVTRGQGAIMADTLVERITGQTHAPDIPVQIQITIPVEALLDPARPLPAHMPGHGPIPVERALGGDGDLVYRRLLTRDGIVIGGDSRQRVFTGTLAEIIKARDDGRCREPYCDAPIREIDHIRRWADGGRTTFTNGRGLCTLHNQVRELPGWQATGTAEAVITTTPTGHTYASYLRVPANILDRPVPPTRQISESLFVDHPPDPEADIRNRRRVEFLDPKWSPRDRAWVADRLPGHADQRRTGCGLTVRPRRRASHP